MGDFFLARGADGRLRRPKVHTRRYGREMPDAFTRGDDSGRRFTDIRPRYFRIILGAYDAFRASRGAPISSPRHWRPPRTSPQFTFSPTYPSIFISLHAAFSSPATTIPALLIIDTYARGASRFASEARHFLLLAGRFLPDTPKAARFQHFTTSASRLHYDCRPTAIAFILH